jgi:hypothetical protein
MTAKIDLILEPVVVFAGGTLTLGSADATKAYRCTGATTVEIGDVLPVGFYAAFLEDGGTVSFTPTGSMELGVQPLATPAAKAIGLLTFAANAANGEQVEIGGKTYTFQTVLTDVDGNVKIGASATLSRNNLVDAINLGPGAGVDYAASTTLHPSVSASTGPGDTMNAEANLQGTAGNSITTTETGANMSWGMATLDGGSDVTTKGDRAEAYVRKWTATLAVVTGVID